MVKKSNRSANLSATDVAFCTCASLRKAARVVTQAYDAALKPAGLKATQFTILATLSRSGDQPLTKLADTLVMDRTTLTRNLKPLIAQGWIFIAREDDQRVKPVGLTEKGRSVFKSALPLWRKVQTDTADGLGLSTWVSLIHDLQDTVEAVQSH